MKLAALLLLTSLAQADIQPSEVLDRMEAAYKQVSAIQITAERRDEVVGRGADLILNTEYTYAEKSGGKYLAKLNFSDTSAVSVSNGSEQWKALPNSKQWQKSSPAPEDLVSATRAFLLTRYTQMRKVAISAELLKEASYKLGKRAVPCYVVRVKTMEGQHDLWIDRERYFVLQDLQMAQTKINNGAAEAKVFVKVRDLRLGNDVADTLFAFEPEKNWKEVETLILPGEQRIQLTGQPATNFSLKTLTGDPVSLESHNGKVVVMYFWATWCGPCRKEIPFLEKLRKELDGKAVFLAINEEEPETIREFLKKTAYPIPVLLDQAGAVHKRYGVRAIPTLFVIDSHGVVREHFIGSRSEQSLRAAITDVVNAN